MIFVTVGTHEQQFNRLIECIDRYASTHDEDVIIQTGFCTYEPKNCEWSKLYPYKTMLKFVEDARIVITHGGPSSFIMALQFGKIPIVVPREEKYGEHVNDHQVNFCRQVAQRMGTIIEIENMDQLQLAIDNYDDMVKLRKNEIVSNNERFCNLFNKLIDDMFKGKN